VQKAQKSDKKKDKKPYLKQMNQKNGTKIMFFALTFCAYRFILVKEQNRHAMPNNHGIPEYTKRSVST